MGFVPPKKNSFGGSAYISVLQPNTVQSNVTIFMSGSISTASRFTLLPN